MADSASEYLLHLKKDIIIQSFKNIFQGLKVIQANELT